MRGTHFVSQSVFSAIALSALTLSVFALSANRGPETTVRRFHQAILEGDSAEVLNLMVDGELETGRFLRLQISDALARGVQIQLGRVTTEGRLSYVDVVYVHSGNRIVGAIRLVVRKPENRWIIDAGSSLKLQAQMNDFS